MISIEKNTALKPFFSLLMFFSGVIIIVSTDQYLKHKVRSNGGFYVCNQGISFNLPLPPVIFWLILVIFLFACFLYFKYLTKNKLLKPLLLFAFIFIIGGALSNSLDRFLSGCIIDFFSIKLARFPFFNLADIMISIGSFLFFISLTTKKD